MVLPEAINSQFLSAKLACNLVALSGLWPHYGVSLTLCPGGFPVVVQLTAWNSDHWVADTKQGFVLLWIAPD